MLNIGVLASTKGTDMQAIIDSISSGKLDARISIVLSDKSDAFAVQRAKDNGIEARFLDPRNYKTSDKERSREEYDRELSKILDKHEVELILLIGYMRYLSKWFVNKYKNRIMNIHPSLLPKYAGCMDKNVHDLVLKNKETETGATLHFVDEGADTGPIIMQKEVKISEKETIETLKLKVQKAEQEIILKALDLYIRGKIRIAGNKVIIS